MDNNPKINKLFQIAFLIKKFFLSLTPYLIILYVELTASSIVRLAPPPRPIILTVASTPSYLTNYATGIKKPIYKAVSRVFPAEAFLLLNVFLARQPVFLNKQSVLTKKNEQQTLTCFREKKVCVKL